MTVVQTESSVDSRPRAGAAAVPRASACAVTISIDVEPDDAWTNHQNPSVRNVHELLRLHDVLRRHGAKATLLVTQRVIDDAACVRTLRRLVDEGGAEVGTHLHPWETPPFLPGGMDTRYATFPHELPLASYTAKLTGLTESIARHFNRPTSYRAGRWGFAAAHVRVLESLGYVTDTSVIPWVNWGTTFGVPLAEGGHGGVDYRRAPRTPYRPAYEDVTRPGGARLVELPVTVGFTRSLPGWLHGIYGRLPELAWKVLRKPELVRAVWATPAEEPLDRLERLVEDVTRRGGSLFNLAFHSSELMEGGSPTSRTAAETDGMFERLNRMLGMLAERGCAFATLTEAARAWAARNA